MISVVIPHKNRNGILHETVFRLHNRQTVSRDLFEIIIVDDGSDVLPDALKWGADVIVPNEGVGPGQARNTGARIAKYDTVLFIGNDTIPDQNLIFRHIYQHRLVGDPKVAVQGLTPFHPSVMDTEFMHFLDQSGLQANWNALRNEDGTWKRNATGYLLTTNWSINRYELELIGGFHASLKKAAWDDVELGMRLNKMGYATVFDPSATNFHYHKYTLDQFARRQFMEGTQRILFALQHPEVAASLISPEEMRQAKQVDLEEQLHVARKFNHLSQREVPQATEMKYNAWMSALRLASIKGVIDSIEGHPLRQVILHLSGQEQVTFAVSTIQAIENGDWGYAAHGVEWLINSGEANWAVWAFAGDVAQRMGDIDLALMRWNKSMNIQPNDWARNKINECTK